MNTMSEPATPVARPARLAALRHRNFRILWVGLTVSAVGTWMQIVAQALLVLDLTHGSALALGTVSLIQAVAFLLFAPIGGGVADRVPRRRLLMFTQVVLIAVSATLAVLVFTGAITFWMVLVAAFAGGATLSFDQPARNAMLADLVPKELLLSAVALQSASFNGAALIGPALAGWTLARFGFPTTFAMNSLSYLAVIAPLFLLRGAKLQTPVAGRASLWSAVREATIFVRRDAVLPAALWAYGALLFLGPSTTVTLPLFARQLLHINASKLGLLFSCAGAGSVAISLLLASIGDIRTKGRLLLIAMAIWTVALAGLGGSVLFIHAAAALLVLGATQAAVATACIALLQTRVPPEMRGRAMSLNTLLIMCVRPLGDFPAGALISRIGLRPTIFISAALVALVALTLTLFAPRLRGA